MSQGVRNASAREADTVTPAVEPPAASPASRPAAARDTAPTSVMSSAAMMPRATALPVQPVTPATITRKLISLSDVEADALRQRQGRPVIDRVRRPAHIRLPGVRASLAAAARLLFAAECAADFR